MGCTTWPSRNSSAASTALSTPPQAGALVTRRDVREPMGRLEGELFEDLHGATTLSGEQPSRRCQTSRIMGQRHEQNEAVDLERGEARTGGGLGCQPALVEIGEHG